MTETLTTPGGARRTMSDAEIISKSRRAIKGFKGESSLGKRVSDMLVGELESGGVTEDDLVRLGIVPGERATPAPTWSYEPSAASRAVVAFWLEKGWPEGREGFSPMDSALAISTQTERLVCKTLTFRPGYLQKEFVAAKLRGSLGISLGHALLLDRIPAGRILSGAEALLGPDELLEGRGDELLFLWGLIDGMPPHIWIHLADRQLPARGSLQSTQNLAGAGESCAWAQAASRMAAGYLVRRCIADPTAVETLRTIVEQASAEILTGSPDRTFRDALSLPVWPR